MDTNYKLYKPYIIIMIMCLCINGCDRTQSTKKNYINEFTNLHAWLKDGDPVYSLKEVQIIVDELIPVISQITGRTFINRPQIKLINTYELEKVLIKERNYKLTNNSSNSSLYNNIKHKSKMVLGLYSKYDKILYLLPQRIPAVLKLFDLDDKYGVDIGKMVIAHELTHALQDQHIKFVDRFSKIPGNDELDAFLAAIEGHAIFIEKKVAKINGIDESIIKLHPLAAAQNNQNIKRAVIRKKFATMQKTSSSTSMIFSQGEKFIQYFYNKSGHEKIWDILHNPPVDTSMIIFPSTYEPRSYDKLDYKKILDDIAVLKILKQSKKLDYEFINKSLSNFSWIDLWYDINNNKKSMIISNIVHSQTLRLMIKNIQCVNIVFVVLNDREHVADFLSIQKKYVMENIKQAVDHEVSLQIYDQYKMDSFQKITGIEKFIHKKNSKERFEKRQFIIANRGNLLVLYEDIFFNLDSREVLKIADGIFHRYSKL